MRGEDGNPVDSAEFDADLAASYEKITAKNFSLSLDILEDLNKIAAADQPNQIGNINNLNELIKMRHNPHMFSEGAPEDFMVSIVSTIGVDSQQAVRLTDNQKVIVMQIDNRRFSHSGVSLDEEMADMVRHQHAYTAAAKMINTMAEIYDLLVNRVGI